MTDEEINIAIAGMRKLRSENEAMRELLNAIQEVVAGAKQWTDEMEMIHDLLATRDDSEAETGTKSQEVTK